MCFYIIPYRNTFNISSLLTQRTVRPCQRTEVVAAFRCSTCPVKNVFIWQTHCGQESNLRLPHHSEAFLPLEDREFPRAITPQHGCYLQITLPYKNTLMKSHLPSFMLGFNMRIKYGSAHCDNVFLYGNHFGTLTPVFLNFLRLTQYTLQRRP